MLSQVTLLLSIVACLALFRSANAVGAECNVPDKPTYDYEDPQTKAITSKPCSGVVSSDCLYQKNARGNCPCGCAKAWEKEDGVKSADFKPKTAADQKKAAGGGGECLSGDDWAQTITGPKRVSNLRIGDHVLVRQGYAHSTTYSPITHWLHFDQSRAATFVVLETADGRNISLTNTHLIYSGSCDKTSKFSARFAIEVAANDCLLVVNEKTNNLIQSKVIRKSTVEKSGLYSPLTEQGSIVVNQIAVSCFSNMKSEGLASFFFRPFHWLKSWVPKSLSTPFLNSEFLINFIDGGLMVIKSSV